MSIETDNTVALSNEESIRIDERLSNGKNDAMGDLETRMSDSNNNTSNEHKFDEIQDGISRT